MPREGDWICHQRGSAPSSRLVLSPPPPLLLFFLLLLPFQSFPRFISHSWGRRQRYPHLPCFMSSCHSPYRSYLIHLSISLIITLSEALQSNALVVLPLRPSRLAAPSRPSLLIPLPPTPPSVSLPSLPTTSPHFNTSPPSRAPSSPSLPFAVPATNTNTTSSTKFYSPLFPHRRRSNCSDMAAVFPRGTSTAFPVVHIICNKREISVNGIQRRCKRCVVRVRNATYYHPRLVCFS